MVTATVARGDCCAHITYQGAYGSIPFKEEEAGGVELPREAASQSDRIAFTRIILQCAFAGHLG